MKDAKRTLILSLILMLFPVIALAQQTSSITGVVIDSNGSTISGATVKLIDTRTSNEQTTKTNELGVYSFHKISPGIGFTLSFSAQGFETMTIRNVTLAVGITATQNAQLAVGPVSNSVTVTADGGVTLNTTDASIGNNIETRRLQELPIQIRESPAALLGLQPGVIGNNLGTGTTVGGVNLLGSSTGSRADQGNITVDGIDANDAAAGQAFSTVGLAPIDSVQEFRTVTTNPGASEGRSSGSQILLVTKSGSNDFHGSLREYNRTAATAANSFFNNRAGIPKAQLTRNQFGGNLGGPVKLPRIIDGKDRLFFFFDYEGRRDAQGVPYLRIVPLDSFRNGNLGYLNNAGGISYLSPAQVAALDPQGIGGNQSLLSLINSRYPRANDLTVGDGINTGGFRFNSPSRLSSNVYTSRIDVNATESQKLFARVNIVRRAFTDIVNSVSQQFPGDPKSGQAAVRDFSVAAGHTWAISPTVANQVTVGVTRASNSFSSAFAPTSPNVFGSPAPTTGGSFGGAFGIAAPFASISTQSRQVPVPTFRDDLNWSKGSHEMSFGVSFKPIRQRSMSTNDFNFTDLGLGGNLPSLSAALRPTDIGADPNNLAINNYDAAFAFLLGRYAFIQTNFNYGLAGNAFPLGIGQSRDYHYNEYEAYAQDSWRVRNDLTLTYGVRYSYFPAPFEANGFQSGNNANLQTLLATRLQNAAAGISGNTAEPFISYFPIGKGNNAPGPYAPDRNNFAPRLSLAWNPSAQNGLLGKVLGDRKTVIRAGGSVVYDRTSGALTFLQDQFNYLFNNTVMTPFGTADPVASLQNDPRFTGTGTLPLQNTAPAITNPATPNVVGGIPVGTATGQVNYGIDQQFKTPYSIEYSFGFQRELPHNFILEMSYVGRQARKLFSQVDAAQILDFRDPLSGQNMLAAFNGLQAQLQAGVSPAAITAQPFFENQINAALGAVAPGLTCAAAFGTPNCTTFLATSPVSPLIQSGNTASVIQALAANSLLAPNVGLSAQYAANAIVTNLGSSSYNGLLVSLRKRFSQGLQFDFNYTYSHSIDNLSSVSNTLAGGLICDYRNLRACRGDSDFDIRHLININGVYDLPFGRGKTMAGNSRGVVNTLIGGWQVGGIFTLRSGLPFSLTTGASPISLGNQALAVLNSGNTSALQQQINDAPDGSIQFFGNQAAALNAVSFTQNGGTGNRNVLRGPNFWNLDTSVLKNFRLPWSERQSLQFRWESFNALNNNAFALPLNNISLPTFGQVTSSASNPREMQFALRYQF
ncbi:MAG: carboxypeptidase regulatory-like domain-containing protein [Blastocatellia bacterium]|nr:carboxypeptidase regulatory-like domain-containing protein [Blastocatellia bacterium]